MCQSRAKAKSFFVFAGCLLTMIAGLALIAGGVFALHSKGFKIASDFVKEESTGDGDGVQVRLRLFVRGIIVCGALAVAASIAGCIGAGRHSKILLCTYSIAALIFGAISLGCGVAWLMMFEAEDGALKEMIQNVCQPESYNTLRYHLKMDKNDPNCGDLDRHQPKITIPQGMTSRVLLETAALASHVFLPVGAVEPRHLATADPTAAPTSAPAEEETTTTTTAPPTTQVIPECGASCRQVLKHLVPLGGCNFLHFVCRKNTSSGEPLVLQRLEFWSPRLVASLFGFGLFLLTSVLCTCCFMYTLGTGKQGKKGGQSFLFRLFCPCLRTKTQSPFVHKRLRTSEDYDEDESNYLTKASPL